MKIQINLKTVLITTLVSSLLVGCKSPNQSVQGQADNAPSNPKSALLTYKHTVKASSSDWQHSGITLLSGDTATLTATGEWYVAGPNNCDSGGNSISADASFAYPSESEGCLILRMNVDADHGDSQCFKGNGKPVYVTTPGEFFFLANDSRHPDDGAGRRGYKDNRGTLEVTILIKTMHPENYPPTP